MAVFTASLWTLISWVGRHNVGIQNFFMWHKRGLLSVGSGQLNQDMAAHRYDGDIKVIHMSPKNMDMSDTDLRKYEISWVDAVLKDNADLARQLLNEQTNTLSIIAFSHAIFGTSNIKGHARSQCQMVSSSYAPDNVWSLAAVYNARNVLRVLVEQNIPATVTTSHGNNYLHCLIAFASIEDEGVEYEVLSTAEYIRSLLSDEMYKEILLAENQIGLRPLELASHLGSMAIFKFIFESDVIYMTMVEDMAFYSIQYHDVTDYVTGNRFFKSPPYLMMLLDEKKVGLKAVREVFLTDPMKTWFSAIMFSNMPYIIIWGLLRMSFLAAFFFAMILSDEITKIERERHTSSTPVNISTSIYNVSNDDIIESIGPALFYTSLYVCVFSSCALLSDTVSFLHLLLRFKQWHLKTVNGTKSLAAYTRFYRFAQICVLIGAFVAGQGVLNNYMTQRYDFSLLHYLDSMVIVAVCTSVWSVLFFLQLVPVLNIYVIAIQRMLGDFASFSIVFGLFFVTFNFGFTLLADKKTSDSDSFYRTFQLMLNIVNYNTSTYTVQFLHVTFIFMIVYLLLNILIAVFTTAYDYVMQHREIIKQVQSLTVTMITEPIAATLFAPLHNQMRRKHLVFRGKKVYVTRVIMKPRHTWGKTISVEIEVHCITY